MSKTEHYRRLVDLDSPIVNHFDEDDRLGLEAIAAVFCKLSDPESRSPRG